MAVAFQRHTMRPFGGGAYGPQPSLPNLTLPAVHRCLRRYGISHLSNVE